VASHLWWSEDCSKSGISGNLSGFSGRKYSARKNNPQIIYPVFSLKYQVNGFIIL